MNISASFKLPIKINDIDFLIHFFMEFKIV